MWAMSGTARELPNYPGIIARMNRTERLYALVEELRSRAPRKMRAVELAEIFEVSTRTIERDLLALQEAGVPIWTQPGPGGGYGLDVDMTLPPLNFTPAEATAIATALAATKSMPFAEAGRSALMKLASAMASGSKDAASDLISHIRIVPGSDDPPGRPVFDVIQRALTDNVAVELGYRDAQARETTRVVEPAGLFATPNGWFVAGWCRLRGAPRSFRLDRIVRATSTGEPVNPRSLDEMLLELPYEFAEPTLE